MKDTKQESVEITDLINDRFYGLPMQKDWLKESYNDKKERFSKLEDCLMNQIAETENPKLMHTFLRWQKVRGELNQNFNNEISVKVDNNINQNWQDGSEK